MYLNLLYLLYHFYLSVFLIKNNILFYIIYYIILNFNNIKKIKNNIVNLKNKQIFILNCIQV